jgi:hypothetical protein
VALACARRSQDGFEVSIEIVCTAKYPLSELGTDASAAVVETTNDPGLHLVVAGRRVQPIYGENGLYIFPLRRGAEEARIVSRTAASSDTQASAEDHRHLGVRIERLVLRSTNEVRDIPVDHPALTDGWWKMVHDGEALHRWTRGDAVLPLPARTGPALLEIHLSDEGSYIVPTEALIAAELRRRSA